jgi:hypothetical protein
MLAPHQVAAPAPLGPERGNGRYFRLAFVDPILPEQELLGRAATLQSEPIEDLLRGKARNGSGVRAVQAIARTIALSRRNCRVLS